MLQQTGRPQGGGRDTNSIMQGWVDRGPWKYWDLITFTGGVQVNQTYYPFSVPLGQQDPITSQTKTLLQTNLTQSRSFAPPRCLLLEALGFDLIGPWSSTDVASLVQTCFMRFKIDEKPFHEGYLSDFPAGGGVTGFTQNAGDSSFTLGLPSPLYQRRYGNWSKYIAPLQQFSMELVFGGGGITAPTLSVTGQNLWLRCTLDGLTDRSVQ